MWYRNLKLQLAIALLVVVIIWLVSSFICGFDYGKCASSPAASGT